MDPFSDGGTGRRASGAGLSTRKKILLVAGSLLALVVLVIVFFSSGSSDDGQDRAGSGASGDRASQGDPQEVGPDAGKGSTSTEQAEQAEQAEKQSNGEPSKPSADASSADAGSDAPADRGSSESDSAKAGPIPERAQDPDVAPQPGEKVQKSHDDGELAFVQAPEGGEGESAQAHENQPGSYDPLGRGAESDGLTGTEKERARFAASNYVTYAYGYTGDDIAEYHDGLFETMLEGEFQDSPGRADIQEVEDDIKDGGLRSAAVLDEFDIKEPGSEQVKGVAYFTVGESYDGGGVSGNTTHYAQPLNLQRSTTGWTVVAADELREV